MPSRNRLRARAKAQMPMVLLTLVSILQALALELLWTHAREHDYLLQASWIAVLGWVQIVATLLGILLIWMLYSSMVMRFRWVPATGDTVFPFLIGILELALIAALGPDMFGRWFVILGALFGVTSTALQIIMRRARLDGENDDFFANVPRATLRDFYPVMTVVGLLVGLGAWLGATGNHGVPALLALLIAAAALLHQMYLNHRYWHNAMTLGETQEAAIEE